MTALMLLSLYKSPVVPLAEICEQYFSLSPEEAARHALRNELPVPTFRLAKSRKAPLLVSVEALAIWLDAQAAEATAQWKQTQGLSPPRLGEQPRPAEPPQRARGSASPDSLFKALVEVSRSADTAVLLAPARRVLLPVAEQITGLTVIAMRRKISSGKWLQGREYFKDPDGKLWVDIEGVMRWVAKGPRQSR